MREHYDVVVVGGGIHGVGVAQAAAAAGHATLLLEQYETLAEGTSSRSSKLIHGGLRYLEGLHVGLVAESLRERALLLELAPGLVELKWFHFPVYRTTRRRPWQIRVGLSLYALLGRLGRDCRFERVPRRRWEALDGLVTDGLQAVFRYRDAQTDDAMLTRAVMRSAQELGARLAAPARLESATLDDNGCRFVYHHEGAERRGLATVLVNAAGPWAGRVLQQVSPPQTVRRVDLVQGAHILVRGTVREGIYYVEAPQDGRAVFVMPWRDETLVGTTETPFDGDPGECRPLAQEEAYLSEVLHRYFPRYEQGILDSYAGLRVLPHGKGRFFSRPREAFLDVDRVHRPRLLTIWGGKLTTYRATAAKVLRRVASSLPARTPVADTRTLPLS